MYRKILLLFFGLALATLVFSAWAGNNPGEIGRYLLAQVGLQVSTPPNQFSILAQQLKNKELTLAEKEQALQEQAAILHERSQQEAKTARYVLIVGGALLMLILLNFYLDRRRKRPEKIKVRKEAVANAPEEVFRIH